MFHPYAVCSLPFFLFSAVCTSALRGFSSQVEPEKVCAVPAVSVEDVRLIRIPAFMGPHQGTGRGSHDARCESHRGIIIFMSKVGGGVGGGSYAIMIKMSFQLSEW